MFLFSSYRRFGDTGASLSPQPLQDGSQGQGATGSVSGALVSHCGLCSQGHSAVLGSEAGGDPGRGASGRKPGLGLMQVSACSSEGLTRGWAEGVFMQEAKLPERLHMWLWCGAASVGPSSTPSD